MRVIMHYTFKIKSKIPFPEWPGIVKEYMKSMNLHYSAFRYYFEFKESETHASISDCPALAPIRPFDSLSSYISNLEDSKGASEEEVMSLIQKIYRRYGFYETYFIYQDVDFFSKSIPTTVLSPGNTPSCYNGSKIVLNRSIIFPNYSGITLSVDILHDGHILSPICYLEAMKQLLPGIKPEERLEIQLNDDEKMHYELLNQSAAPKLEPLEEFFDQHLRAQSDTPSAPGDNKISLAGPLKKMCLKYGYDYVKYTFNTFYIQKRTANGHYILLQFDMGSYNTFMRPNIFFSGLGFHHCLFSSLNHASRNASEAADLLICVFESLSEAEKTLLPALDAHYPPTPEWFVPVS